MDKAGALIEIEKLIIKKRIEINIIDGVLIPEYYYIGLGKSASKSIILGLDKTTAHWHRVRYFERRYKTNLLSQYGISLFDVIIYLSKKYKFKPLIIECYRDPIAWTVSQTFQRVKAKSFIMPVANQVDHILSFIKVGIRPPEALQWDKHFSTDLLNEFDIDRKYLYKETEIANLLFLRFEDIKERKSIFAKHGYPYNDLHENKTVGTMAKLYHDVLEKYKFTEEFLREFYNTKIITSLYSTPEIEGFINRWKIKGN